MRRTRRWTALAHLAVVILAAYAAVAINAAPAAGEDRSASVSVHLFWQEGCPHCASAKTELDAILASDNRISLKSRQVAQTRKDDALFIKLIALFEHAQAAVPLVVIGTRSFVGFRDDGSSSEDYRRAIDDCLEGGCIDVVARLEELSGTIFDRPPAASGRQNGAAEASRSGAIPETIDIPLFGPVRTADLSLPVLTVVMAAIDGFNPCAMWVLVFLIGLLVGLQDMRRMWILGIAFLAATGVMYFAVMAAWLNVVLYFSAIAWIRLGIAALAVAGGLYYLREYWTNPDGVCRVTAPGQRGRIMDAFRTVVNDHPLPLAVIGVMGLAILVNFVELLCSAGIPAVYTQVLALSDLPIASFYGYLMLYIAVFMLDDLAIFAAAMVAIRATGLTGSYARYSHLLGGVVLLTIGAVMALRPDLLAFG